MKLSGPLIPVLSLSAGIIAGHVLGFQWWCGVIPIAMAIGIYFILLSVSGNPMKAYRIGKWHPLWVMILFVGIGMTDESLSRPQRLEDAFGGTRPDSVTCEITEILSKTYGDRINVLIQGTNGAKARFATGATELSAGDIIRIPSAQLREISKDTSEIGQKVAPMLKARGILYSGYILPKNIKAIGKSNSPRYLFLSSREKIETAIERSHIKKPTSDFLNAILLGDKTGLDERMRLTFANGGLAHVLALSGMHIGIIAGFILILMWPLKFAGKYKLAYIATILILWLYVIITGMSYSSVRACIMATLAFCAILIERKNFAGDALASACFLILLFDPAALFDAGFQLSVVCVGALIAFASPLNPIDHRSHPMLYRICGALLATMVATVASWVLTSFYFSQIPLMFLPANLLLLPLLPIYVALALIFVGALCFGMEIHWLSICLDEGYEFLVWGVEKLSLGQEYVVDYQVPLWVVASWLGLLAVAAIILNRKSITS